MDESHSDEDEKLWRAKMHLEAALHLLDETNVPAAVGAYVDLALCRLKDILRNSPPLTG
jgi:hypothetical protein